MAIFTVVEVGEGLGAQVNAYAAAGKAAAPSRILESSVQNTFEQKCSDSARFVQDQL